MAGTESLGHYDELIIETERIGSSKEDIHNLLSALRKEGVSEPLLIELEAELEYVFSQWKVGVVEEFKMKCRIDELEELTNKILFDINVKLD